MLQCNLSPGPSEGRHVYVHIEEAECTCPLHVNFGTKGLSVSRHFQLVFSYWILAYCTISNILPHLQQPEYDWIRIYTDVNKKTTYYFRQNLGSGKFGPTTTFDPAIDCSELSNKAFADFNNDGYADFFCIGDKGSVQLLLNRGGSPPKFEYIGFIVPESSVNGGQVRIGDIDGDGRADFCFVETSSDVKCSRNAGTGDKYSWQWFITVDGLRGTVFNKKTGTNPQGLYHIGDVNGDYLDPGECGILVGYPKLSAPVVPGDEITMYQTNNNRAGGTYTEGDDVTFNVGDRLGMGSGRSVFYVDCRGRAACNSLGSVVLKYYSGGGEDDVVGDERKHLARIDELKAVIRSDSSRHM
jgi:hypothetical protein